MYNSQASLIGTDCKVFVIHVHCTCSTRQICSKHRWKQIFGLNWELNQGPFAPMSKTSATLPRQRKSEKIKLCPIFGMVSKFGSIDGYSPLWPCTLFVLFMTYLDCLFFLLLAESIATCKSSAISLHCKTENEYNHYKSDIYPSVKSKK